MPNRLSNTVAVVTGASRGVGKGVALGLGEAGATVYLTARTLGPGDSHLPGTLTQTADEVTRLGGRGIAAQCDHADDTQVAAVFARVLAEQGRLDLLVNNAFATPVGAWDEVPFWELPLDMWDRLITVGLRSYYVASAFAARHMVTRKRGLIVNISSWGARSHFREVPYGVGKAGVEKLTADTAEELRPHNVGVVSLWPPFTKTELVLAEGEPPTDVLPRMATPRFTGRAVAALASDPHIMDKSGRRFVAAALAEEYDFTDLDGARPTLPTYARFHGEPAG
ncbi:MAG TPA: SDR family NAD(P)-dependent oxidoreductase [Ktedonobacterales bacterium]|nr:SDR family NAD(P)-dependent oxidoreductase [Ktedonobacterales bacterium]